MDGGPDATARGATAWWAQRKGLPDKTTAARRLRAHAPPNAPLQLKRRAAAEGALIARVPKLAPDR